MNELKNIKENRNKNILYAIGILILFIITPFCLSMFYPNNIVLIISILLLGFGLITEASTLYKIDEYNKELKKSGVKHGDCI